MSIACEEGSRQTMEVTPYVGIVNQGATCYMNSILQTLYHIPLFRKALYEMPTANDNPEESLPLALQMLFCELQCKVDAVSTIDFTKSLGWTDFTSFMQHDVHEFHKILCEKLEDKMKGTSEEGAIKKLFEGHQITRTECINVEYESDHKGDFHELHLLVRGCTGVYSSLDKLLEADCLEGGNQFNAGKHGYQDAKTKTIFTEFPPILQLHLKRFELDHLQTKKIEDRYEYPLELDLDKYMSPDAEKKGNQYILYSVLVHEGESEYGHYYAYVRPTLSEWYKFDDLRVRKEDTKAALEDQYGGFKNHSNAYMLVYIRESEKDNIFCNVEDTDIPKHLMVSRNTNYMTCDLKVLKGTDHHYNTVRNDDFAPAINEVVMGEKIEGDVSLIGNYSGIQYALKYFKRYERNIGRDGKRLFVVFLYYVGTVKYPSHEEEEAIFVACKDEYEADEIHAYAHMLTSCAAMKPRGYLKAKDHKGSEQVLLLYYPFDCLFEDGKLEKFIGDTMLNQNPIPRNTNTTVSKMMKELTSVVKEMKQLKFSTELLQLDVAYVRCFRTGSIAIILGKITKVDTDVSEKRMEEDFMHAIQSYLLKDYSLKAIASFFTCFGLKCINRLDMILYHPVFEDDLIRHINFWSELQLALQECVFQTHGHFRHTRVTGISCEKMTSVIGSEYDWTKRENPWCSYFVSIYDSKKTHEYKEFPTSHVKFLSNTVEHIPSSMTYEELVENIDATWSHIYHHFHAAMYLEGDCPRIPAESRKI